MRDTTGSIPRPAPLGKTAHKASAGATSKASETTLFCIPHAGGSASYYSQFGSFFPGHVTVHALEAAGRGRRFRDPLATSMESISSDLFEQIKPVAGTAPYALFGHSMGALLSLLCVVLAQENHIPLPKALFVSACATPKSFCNKPETPISSLPPEELWRHIAEMGGLPEEIAASREFCEYLEPILYADFTALDNWQPKHISPLPVPITVFLGSQDPLTERKGREWKRLTTRDFSMQSFHGNHFYLQEHWSALAAQITSQLVT